MPSDAAVMPDATTYEAIQHAESSWSHDSVWGLNALQNLGVFYEFVTRQGWLAEDDTFADFGGNDGTVAAQWGRWSLIRGWAPDRILSIDMDGIKQAKGAILYPEVEFIQARLERIPLPDDSVDWGFCSHTLEHVEDVGAAFKEIARVVSKGLFVVLPVETDEFRMAYNVSHLRASEDLEVWRRWLDSDLMTLHLWGKPLEKMEFHLLYTKAPKP